MPKKAAADTVIDKSLPAPGYMQLRKRSIKPPKENPKKKKKTKARAAKANPPQANQEATDDSVPAENGERKNNEAPIAGENEAKSE
ncbi:non-histone chromosomal protein HMG-14-like isoform X2 [Chiloscyllium plagiosum]|uniref:non-histone chromosomal protein HMG-14-like isoform X2 n=1 Tax=Chiloscyllium plagiosum TaxID=36176 RepID=UPI001CB7D771|nr:non-histone chromosomal protein HMG-14-like isoform X2 [Chiloscyllium plagiosum]